MLRKWSVLSLLVLLAVVVSSCGTAAPATYPKESLEIVAPAGAGGGWDTLARTVQRSLELEKLYPQPMSVVNKTGGGGAVGMAYVVGKKGTDYNLVVYSPPLIIGTLNKTFANSYKELTPLAKLITDYQLILVKADSKYKTLGDLVTDLKADTAAVKFAGGSAPGNMDHLAIAKLAKTAGVDPKNLSYIAFNGGGEAMTALLGGNVAFMSSGAGESIAQLEAGTVRALGVTSAERRGGALKDVPTVKEQGIDMTYEVWRGIFGPPGMTDAAKKYWDTQLKSMVGTKTWKESLDKLQWVDAYAPAADFSAFLDKEYASYSELMTTLGFAK
jgi:putative tricarboxylic transport membrane protein